MEVRLTAALWASFRLVVWIRLMDVSLIEIATLISAGQTHGIVSNRCFWPNCNTCTGEIRSWHTQDSASSKF